MGEPQGQPGNYQPMPPIGPPANQGQYPPPAQPQYPPPANQGQYPPPANQGQYPPPPQYPLPAQGPMQHPPPPQYPPNQPPPQYPQANIAPYPAPYSQPPPPQVVIISEERRPEQVAMVSNPQGNQYVILDSGQLGFAPQMVICPACHQNVLTRIQRSLSAAGWISCVFLFLLFLFFWLLPLCCIPCCIPGCYDVKHYCPSCGNFIGERKR